MTIVRIAQAADAPSLLAIYQPYVLDTAFSFETQVPTVDEFAGRIRRCLLKFPWLVCEIDGIIAGYVYASAHRDREAYQWTCECSVYIAENFKGRSIGRNLYQALFQLLKLQGLRNVYAGITMPNEPSENLHRKCGFTRFAVYDHVGCKFGQWHKVGWWELQINHYDPSPAPPLAFSSLDHASLLPLFDGVAEAIEKRIKGS